MILEGPPLFCRRLRTGYGEMAAVCRRTEAGSLPNGSASGVARFLKTIKGKVPADLTMFLIADN